MILRLKKDYETWKAGQVIDVTPELYNKLTINGFNTQKDGNNRNNAGYSDGRVRRRG